MSDPRKILILEPARRKLITIDESERCPVAHIDDEGTIFRCEGVKGHAGYHVCVSRWGFYQWAFRDELGVVDDGVEVDCSMPWCEL
jgi:hypothetical protein